MDGTGVIAIGVIVLLIVMPIGLIATATSVRRESRRTGASTGAGGLMGLDELFHPSGENARAAWDSEQKTVVPAPSPDPGPGFIEEGRRITIDV